MDQDGNPRMRTRSASMHFADNLLEDSSVLDLVGDFTAACTPSPGSGSGEGAAGAGSGAGAGFGRGDDTSSSEGGGSSGSGSGSESGGESSEEEAGNPGRRGPRKRVSSKTKKILTTLEPPSAARASASLLSGEGVRRRSTEEDEEELEEQKMVAEESERAAKEGAGAGAKSARKRPQDRPFDYTIKLLLLGDSGVGKTSIMHRYADQKFSPSLLSTAGVDYKTKYLKVNGKTVKCQIWDTAGQQRFHIITQTYYRGAHGIILVYDASDPSESSFSNVRYWMKSIKDHSSPSTQKILLGNKIDVPHKQIDSTRGKATAEEYGIGFWETSAKDGTNVSKAFNAIAKDIVERMALGPPAGHDPPAAPPDTKADPGKRCAVM